MHLKKEMTSTPSKDDISLLLSELRLLLTCDMKAATVKIVHAQLKKDYVVSRCSVLCRPKGDKGQKERKELLLRLLRLQ